MIRLLCLLCCLHVLSLCPAADEAPAAGPAATAPVPAPTETAAAPGAPGAPDGVPKVDDKTTGGGQGKDEGKQPEPQSGGLFGSPWFLLIIVGFIIFMFMSSRGAQKRERVTREQMLANLKLGDKIVTIGGLRGEVVRKGEDTVDIKINELPGGQATFSLSAIAKVNPDAAPADKDA